MLLPVSTNSFDAAAALKLANLIPVSEWKVEASPFTSAEEPLLELVSLEGSFWLEATFEGGLLINREFSIDGAKLHTEVKPNSYLSEVVLQSLKQRVNPDGGFGEALLCCGIFCTCTPQAEIKADPLAQFIEATVDKIAISRGLPINIPGRYEYEEDFGNNIKGPRYNRLKSEFEKND